MYFYRFPKTLLLGISLILNLIFILGIIFLTQRLGGLRYIQHRMNAKGLSGIYENRKNLLEQLPIQKGDYVFIGDSITEFGQWQELLQNSKVKNRGMAGDTTWGLLRRLKNILKAQPKAIFLMIGINDFLFTNRAEIIENYTKIVQEISLHAPHTQLYIQSILPVNPNVKNTVFQNKEILLLNQALKIIAEKEQLSYLDIHQHLLDQDGNLAAQYTADGIHINGNAYKIWQQLVETYID